MLKGLTQKEQIAALRKENSELRSELKSYKSELKSCQELIVRLESQVLSLQHRLDNQTNSSNSSLPPSKDIKRSQQQVTTPAPRGGKKGHKGNGPQFATPTEIVEVKANYCTKCGSSLSGVPVKVSYRSQEIGVEVKPIVREFVYHSHNCKCGHVVNTKPKGASPVRFSSSIVSLASYLVSENFISYARLVTIFREVFGITISEGTLVSACKRVGRNALLGAELVRKKVANEAVVGADETTFKYNGRRGYAWIYQSENYTYIKAANSRSKAVYTEMFPSGLNAKVLVSDAYAVHLGTPTRHHQLCLAHISRDLKKVIELEDTDWAKKMKDWLHRAVALHKKSPTPEEIKAIEREKEELLAASIPIKHQKTRTLLARLVKNKDALTTFLTIEGVPPDNNGSERGIRHFKVKESVAKQFVTFEGATLYAALRTLSDTARKQKQSIYSVYQTLANFNNSSSE